MHAVAWATGEHVGWWETAGEIAVPASVAGEAGAGGFATAGAADQAMTVGVVEQQRRLRRQQLGRGGLPEVPLRHFVRRSC